MSTIISMLEDDEAAFTKADRKVVRVLAMDYPRAGLQTVAQIAEQAGTSGPSVIRLVRKLGFDGFAAFQGQLLQELGDRLASPFSQINDWALPAAAPPASSNVETTSPSQLVLIHFIKELQRSFAQLRDPELDEVARMLLRPRRRVFTLGGRYSYLLADYLASHLHQFRAGALALPRGEIERLESLVDLRKDDVLIVFDYRRYDEDVRHFCEQARTRRASIILMTDNYGSPILPLASHVLSVSVSGPSPFDSLVPALALVETLIARMTALSEGQAIPRIATIDALRRSLAPGDDG